MTLCLSNVSFKCYYTVCKRHGALFFDGFGAIKMFAIIRWLSCASFDNVPEDTKRILSL